ncbi:T9SS type B sorting domain-containing protein [Tenacibaculum amylolyticum]|uniref:T9SS type B sorting domain-containing protein n=1 Tax=Tenacibaculum amylolyticum TaxID=104269 RepID=UPI003896501E
MKRIFIITCLFLVSNILAQNTFIPDDNFEQVLINQGLDTPPLDDFVPTANIVNILELFILNANISDLTGIEDFRSLEHLQVNNNNLTTINVSTLRRLKTLSCENNQLTTLDISANIFLENLFIDNNNISVLNISNNNRLSVITTVNNPIESLDLSNKENLRLIELDNNNLSFLDIRNNNNNLIEVFSVLNNPNLQCIFVDNTTYSTNNWLNKDSTTFFVETEKECFNITCMIQVDTLENIDTCIPYSLPNLTNGNYFTASGGNGTQLFAGDIISTSQTIYIYNQDIGDANCFRESNFTITICADTSNDTFPSYFTPNEDGINDYWKVTSELTIKNIYIFNRYGTLLSTPTPENGWDGLINGQKAPSNTYWYKIVFENDSFKIGSFSLLRK